MSFGITPASAFPAPTGGEPARGIQFQFNGVNVGERNTDTVNIRVDGVSTVAVTIGVGEQANILTVGNTVVAPPPEPTALWLDLFDGTLDTLLVDHAQDIPLGSSVWSYSDANMWRLDGASGAKPDADASTIALSFFDESPAGVPYLQWGWRIEATFTVPTSNPTQGLGYSVADNYSMGLRYSVDDGGWSLYAVDNDGNTLTAPIDPAPGQHTMVITVNETSVSLALDDVVVDTFTLATDNVQTWQAQRTAVIETQSYAPDTYTTFQRVAIMGIIDHWETGGGGGG